MRTLNWVYGAGEPEEAEAVTEIMRAAHQYRNRLCELELAKRERHEALLQRLAPEYVAACEAVTATEQRLADAREAIQRERQRQRTKTPTGCEHHQSAAEQAKRDLRELRATRQLAKRESYETPAVRKAMAANQQQHREEVAAAKRASGLYWGTEAIVTQACQSFRAGAPPRFARWEGEGQVAAQLQGGLCVTEADGTSGATLLQILIPPATQQILEARGKLPRSRRRGEVLLRVGSDGPGGRVPIFARIPIRFHRPLPSGGRIKWAYLERRMIANRARWTVRLTIDVPDMPPRDSETWCALHIGWLRQGGSIRAGIWRGSDGQQGEIVLPDGHCRQYEYLDEVRSARDRDHADHRDELRGWMAERSVPDWMAERTETIAHWRSPARMAALILHWRDHRIEGDEEVFTRMDAWRRRDKHAWQHSRRLQKRLVRRRSCWYRELAKRLSDRYGTLYYAQFANAQLCENSDPEDLERDNPLVHRAAKIAAVSDLTRMVREQFGAWAVEVPSEMLTKECSRCGEVTEPDLRRRLTRCQCRQDIDESALANTIARGHVLRDQGAVLAALEAQEVAAQAKRDKLAAMQEARRAARRRQQEG